METCGGNGNESNESGEAARVLAWFKKSPVYAILDTSLRPEFQSQDILEALLRGGVRVIQYRHKGEFRRAQFEECCALAARTRERGGRFLVNDRADVAKLCGAHGVHLGQTDLPPDKARRYLGEDFWIGHSTHSLEQAREAAALPVDYVAIGPVFATATKQKADPVVGLETVSQARSVIAGKPLVAIGGITIGNASAVLAAGADAVAVIRDLLALPDLDAIEARAREFVAALALP